MAGIPVSPAIELGESLGVPGAACVAFDRLGALSGDVRTAP